MKPQPSLDEIAQRAAEAFQASLDARSLADDLASYAGDYILKASARFATDREFQNWRDEHVLIPAEALMHCTARAIRLRTEGRCSEETLQRTLPEMKKSAPHDRGHGGQISSSKVRDATTAANDKPGEAGHIKLPSTGQGGAPITIQDVMDAFPNLTCDGFVLPIDRGKRRDEERFTQARASLLGADQQVEFSRQWLRDNCVLHTTVNQRLGSYSLKHRIETENIYISNGACIAAFILEGYQVYHHQSWGPNCAFNVKLLTDKEIQQRGELL